MTPHVTQQRAFVLQVVYSPVCLFCFCFLDATQYQINLNFLVHRHAPLSLFSVLSQINILPTLRPTMKESCLSTYSESGSYRNHDSWHVAQSLIQVETF